MRSIQIYKPNSIGFTRIETCVNESDAVRFLQAQDNPAELDIVIYEFGYSTGTQVIADTDGQTWLKSQGVTHAKR